MEDTEELLRLHSLDNFYEILNEGSGYQIRQERLMPIPPADTLNNIMKYSWVLGYSTHVYHSFRQLHVVKRLTAELSRVAASDFNNSLRAESIRYLYNVAAREAIILGKSNDADRLKFLPSLYVQLLRLQNFLDQYARNTGSTTPKE
ncbi:MAG: hypothetical protein R3A80_09875 [Bdellovibrionota bacterium]